jgi:hypothetical protein
MNRDHHRNSSAGRIRVTLRALAVLIAGVAALAVGPWAPVATAAGAPAPALGLEAHSVPTVMRPGAISEGEHGFTEGVFADARIEATLINRGAGETTQPITVVDDVPSGLTVSGTLRSEWLLGTNGTAVEENPGGNPCQVAGNTVTCTIEKRLPPGQIIHIYIPVDVAAGASGGVENEITATAQGARSGASTSIIPIGEETPPFGFVEEGGLSAKVFDESGEVPAAGTHPYSFSILAQTPQVTTQGAKIRSLQPLRSLYFELPEGLVANPLAQVRCRPARLESEGNALCPVGSQVGVIRFTVASARFEEALYDLVPPRGVPAEFGFNVFETQIRVRGGLSGDFRLSSSSTEILSKFSLSNVEAELWGEPSNGGHDHIRYGENCKVSPCVADAASAPFLTMPVSCGPMSFAARVVSWMEAEDTRSVAVTDRSGQAAEVAGCQSVPFSPTASVHPTSGQASSPTGLALEVHLPQNQSPEGTATATLKKVTVRFPQGVAVNPPAADGLVACSESEIGVGNSQPAACPPASKVGSAEITTPLLEGPLQGSIYLAEQQNNPFGTLLALYLAVEDEGVVIKLPGRVDVDPATGAPTATFDDNPQLPFESLNVKFNEGPRATLVTPSGCGTYDVTTELTSWASSTPVVIHSPFSIDQGCSSGGFSPGLEAGTMNPVAGAFSPFTLRVTRQDGEQNLSQISATLPKGLLAKLAGVPLCPDAQAGSGDCPAASQVGTTTTGIGAGTQPLYIPQAGKSPTAIYLAGPYRGAPYSLVVKVPAQAGPFDLGKIAVRVALNVDPFTAQVTASSDPLPQILEGIPVTYRDVRVEVTRPEFMVNPTNCEPMQTTSTIAAISGASASPTSRFQVADCSSLAFKPSLKLSLKGATKRLGHPALKAVVTYPQRGAFANIARAQVNLPHAEFLDQGNLNNTCTRPVLLEGKCPKSSIYGKAKAWTPLLAQPIEGPVYLVGGFGYKLPALVAELNGQIRILLKGKVDTGPNHGIRNTFEAAPDAPISRFVLEMKGGKKYGLFENSESLCAKSQRAIAHFTGQNGKVEKSKPLIAVSCGGGKK